ncbi:uncharacterized protein LOC106649442 [Trichogramma pretiosum]|uniref:uncharacterized protein LOC106649442 n=1 Tax=Trichogramma pretiosum TaxID=7493 RepID=UPI0006C9B387|nr:uncharacterized protein LOC106649442 [Trichogramma pretiosum]
MERIIEQQVNYLNSCKSCLRTKDGKGAGLLNMLLSQACRGKVPNSRLPKEEYGPKNMCEYCGCLWSQSQPKVRIISGKKPSKSILKIIKAKESNKPISKIQKSLMKKALKNKKQTVAMTCNVCLKTTKIYSHRPDKVKAKKEKIEESVVLQSSKKKKKKKDKTAGLNLSGILPSPSPLPLEEVKKPLPPKQNNGQTPLQKIRAINLLKAKEVKNLKDKGKKKSVGKSLNDFLKEIY